MAGFRRRPITIGNTRATGLARDNLGRGSRERYPPEKRRGGVDSRERDRTRLSHKFRQGLPDNSATRHFVSDVSGFLVALFREQSDALRTYEDFFFFFLLKW